MINRKKIVAPRARTLYIILMLGIFAGGAFLWDKAMPLRVYAEESPFQAADVPQEPTESESEIISCTIEGDRSQITLQAEVTLSDELRKKDGVFLFALAPYEEDCLDEKSPVASFVWEQSEAEEKEETELEEEENDVEEEEEELEEPEYKLPDTLTFEVNFDLSSDATPLYSRYVMACKEGDTYIISQDNPGQYITNPEAVAEYSEEIPEVSSKKGLCINPTEEMAQDVRDLSPKHGEINIVVSQLFTSDTREGIPFEYNGKVFYFDKGLAEHYDDLIHRMCSQNMVVTAVLLNRYYEGSLYEALYSIGGGSASANYYEFNTSDQEGFEQVMAAAGFLGERYSGAHEEYGRICNWVIGNEVNNQRTWNGFASTDFSSYIAQHARTLRAFFTALSSYSENARVYLSLDHEWTVSHPEIEWWSGKQVLDAVNEQIRSFGNIPWGVAYHPYPVPLANTAFWDDPVTQDVNTGEISFQNLSVLTDYLKREELLFEDTVRPVILTEQGFTSLENFETMSQKLQAAAYAYAYYIVEANPYIECFQLSRHIDNTAETAAGLNFGIWTCKGQPGEIPNTKKYIWRVFRDIDTDRSEQVSAFALPLLAKTDWDAALAAAGETGDEYRSFEEIVNGVKNTVGGSTRGGETSIAYQSYVNGLRWNVASENGAESGTPGSGKGLRSVSIVLQNQDLEGMVEYRSFLMGKGWQPFVSDSDATSSGTEEIITALEVQLKGEISSRYDVWYRVYLHDTGWSAWGVNGSAAGDTESSSFAESVQIRIQEKGVLMTMGDGIAIEKETGKVILPAAKHSVTIADLIQRLSPTVGVSCYDGAGQVLSDTVRAATGQQLIYRYANSTGEHKDVYGIVVRGDGNGDGLVNIADITRMVGIITGTAKVSGIMWEGCDTNGDGSVNIADITRTVSLIQ